MKLTETLAPGAPPAADFIPLSVPEIRGNEWRYVKECLDTNWVSSVGPSWTGSSRWWRQQAGQSMRVATVNGTSALHVALLVAGVRPDDEVLVSTLTFIAPVNAIRYVGAWPVFIDAETRLLADGSREGRGVSRTGLPLESRERSTTGARDGASRPFFPCTYSVIRLTWIPSWRSHESSA